MSFVIRLSSNPRGYYNLDIDDQPGFPVLLSEATVYPTREDAEAKAVLFVAAQEIVALAEAKEVTDMPLYTLVAYKDHGQDSCRGCVMEEYPAEHSLWTGTSSVSLAKHWAELLIRNHKKERGDCNFEFAFLINGVLMSSTLSSSSSEELCGYISRAEYDTVDERYETNLPQFRNVEALVREYIRIIEQEKAEKEAAAEARRLEEAALKAQQQKEATERKELARLLSLYGNPNQA